MLDAAVELFARQGYDATSVAQVIARAGVAKGGFYHHFASKEALLYEVYGDLITRQLAAMDEILAAGSSRRGTLRALIDDLVESTAASAQQALVFWRELHRLATSAPREYRTARRRYHDTVIAADPRRPGGRRVRCRRLARDRDVHDLRRDQRAAALVPPDRRASARPRSPRELADFVLAGWRCTSMTSAGD